MHEVLVNRLGGLSLPRKSVVRLTDRPDMTLDVYRGRKTTMQQQWILSIYFMSLGLRIGKGEGFADLEWAMMMAMGAVTKDTVVITTVHDSQIVDIPESLIEDHDLTVDYIVTQTEIINCKNRRPKPAGIVWSKLEPIKVCYILFVTFSVVVATVCI